MGVDIQTYRARIGTNKFAFGSDVVTSSISVNFSLFLKSTTVSLFLVVMCLVLKSGAYDFSLIDAVDVANEKKAEQNLELQLPSIDAVRYIPALLGPLWNCLVLKQRIAGFTGAVLFIGLLLLRGGIEPNPGPIPEFPMVIRLTDKLKLTVKCGKLHEIQKACLLVGDEFQKQNQKVLRVPFPVWDDYKPYTAKNVVTFGNDLRNALVKGLTQCEERRCSTVAFTAIVAGNSCQELSEVYIGYGILEFCKETKGTLQEIQIVGGDEKILFDIHHCLAYMVRSYTQPPWFDISIFMTKDVAIAEEANVKLTGRARHSSISAEVKAVFEELSLIERISQKITLNEALALDISKSESSKSDLELSDTPWALLHELLHGNWEGRDNVPDTQQDDTGDWLEENGEHVTVTEISAMDIFMATFHSCDGLLKQALFKKMYLCKLAMPFLYHSVNTNAIRVSLWPLQQFPISDGNLERCALTMKTNVITFVRLGRPQFSKSMFLNRLIQNRHDAFSIFFNRECKSGLLSRVLFKRVVEIFWDTPANENKPIRTYMNVRSDFAEEFKSQTDIWKCLIQTTDLFVVIIELNEMVSNFENYSKLLIQIPKCVILFSEHNDIGKETKISIQDKIKKLRNNHKDKFKVISTHERGTEKETEKLLKNMLINIAEHLKTCQAELTLEERINQFNENNGHILEEDENEDLSLGKELAKCLMSEMTTEIVHTNENNSFQNCISILTPVSYYDSPKLIKTLRLQNQAEDRNEIEEQSDAIFNTRKECLSNISNTVRLLAKYLVNTRLLNMRQKYFIGWLRILIEQKIYHFLCRNIKEKEKLLDTIAESKSDKTRHESDKENEERFLELDGIIKLSSLTVERLFREISHVYDSIIELEKDPKKYRLPSVNDCVDTFSNLIIEGETVELMTESFFMPRRWLQNIFKSLDGRLPVYKIKTISVLGLQSSGKSTVLNTMFGVQFAVKSGRCTTGIQARLLPVGQHNSNNEESNYVMILDTEGLRSPLLSGVWKPTSQDNELATFVTGLGNLSIINVMGEKLADMKDILQIVIHALIKIKSSQNRISLGHKCVFIHHNVTVSFTDVYMKEVYRDFDSTLDLVAEEVVKNEGIPDIYNAKHVLKFDAGKDVHPVQNLWQGGHSLRRISPDYSKSILEIKDKVMTHLTDYGFKSFSDLSQLAFDVWDGINSEQSIFTFRSSIEMKAYYQTEDHYKLLVRNIGFLVRDEHANQCFKFMSDCQNEEELKQNRQEVVSLINEFISRNTAGMNKEFMKFLEEQKMANLGSLYVQRFENEFQELKRRIENDTNRYFDEQLVKMDTSTISSYRRDQLRYKTAEIVSSSKGKDEKKAEFDKIWSDFENEITAKTFSIQDDCLYNDFAGQFSQTCAAVFHQRKDGKGSFYEHLSGINGITKHDFNLSKTNYCTKLFFGKDFVHDIVYPWLRRIVGEFESLLSNYKTKRRLLLKNDVIGFAESFKQCHDKYVTDLKEIGIYAKPSFSSKLFADGFHIASGEFLDHNVKYDLNTGVTYQLKKYKHEMYAIFEEELEDRYEESAACKLFFLELENCLKGVIESKLPTSLCKRFLTLIPNTKRRLIASVCEYIATDVEPCEVFEYTRDPKQFALEWFKRRCLGLFDITLEDRLKCHLIDIENDIKNALKHCEHQCKQHNELTTHEWLEHFEKEFKYVPIDPKRFPGFLNKNKFKTAVHFATAVLDERQLTKMLSSLKDELKCGVTRRDFTDSYDFRSMFDDIWGCPELCPFCREPCIKGKVHTPDLKHECLQHKPPSFKGVRGKYNNYCFDVCNYEVGLRTSVYRCSDINGACGCTKSKLPDIFAIMFSYVGVQSGQFHLYNKYMDTELFKYWDIKVSKDTEECSRFWAWFSFSKYNKICEKLVGKHENIPERWKKISKEKAIASLYEPFM
ncbi:interferon-induced very large GTPase 1-like isoform X2 [Mya arenaria]|uniref:interferon-induced very large GTPase 1-like isoform X2 n=1 Tax=Mya arenaria TaxID=6604 RepID=UPI0022E90C8F|nr:interferon-induced very large GTPase 1-like isoform X2 [Mya arenaria]